MSLSEEIYNAIKDIDTKFEKTVLLDGYVLKLSDTTQIHFLIANDLDSGLARMKKLFPQSDVRRWYVDSLNEAVDLIKEQYTRFGIEAPVVDTTGINIEGKICLLVCGVPEKSN